MAMYLSHKSALDLPTLMDDDNEESSVSKDEALKLGGCVVLGAATVFAAVAAVNAIQANKKVSHVDEIVSDLDAQVTEAEKAEKKAAKKAKKAAKAAAEGQN